MLARDPLAIPYIHGGHGPNPLPHQGSLKQQDRVCAVFSQYIPVMQSSIHKPGMVITNNN